MEAEPNPQTMASDRASMSAFWEMVDAILGGAETMRAAGPIYLPKFENETAKDYEERKKTAPFTNIYADISRDLSAKPFSKQLVVGEGASQNIAGRIDGGKRSDAFVDNVDGRGNNLHVFAADSYKAGIDYGLDWILVDYPKATTDRALTQAEEVQRGLRPYWVHVRAKRVLAAYSDFLNGKEILVHVRLDESTTVREGFEEKTYERVRVIDRVPIKGDDGAVVSYGPATWTIYEKQKAANSDREQWVAIEDGTYTIGVIPLVPFIPGDRIGTSFAVRPPLKDIAYAQVEEFQQESNLKAIKNLTAFPMLVGEGVQASDENGTKIVVPVGPRAVLLPGTNASGENATFKFIEPAATSLTFLEESLTKHRKQMRELGMQPLTETNITVITSANVSRKAGSVSESWAIKFQDMLEQCFVLTSMWLKETPSAEALVHTDFTVDLDGAAQLDSLLKAQAQGVLSKETVQSEFKRRGVVSDEFDPAVEKKRLEQDQLSAVPAIDPVTGEPVQPLTRPQKV